MKSSGKKDFSVLIWVQMGMKDNAIILRVQSEPHFCNLREWLRQVNRRKNNAWPTCVPVLIPPVKADDVSFNRLDGRQENKRAQQNGDFKNDSPPRVMSHVISSTHVWKFNTANGWLEFAHWRPQKRFVFETVFVKYSLGICPMPLRHTFIYFFSLCKVRHK